MIQFINNYWAIIIAVLAIISWSACAILNFTRLPKTDQINNIKEWLRYAVTEAEKELQGGVGELKLRKVYNMFVAQFPSMAFVVSFETFSSWVDEALVWMKAQMGKNKNIDIYVKGE